MKGYLVEDNDLRELMQDVAKLEAFNGLVAEVQDKDFIRKRRGVRAAVMAKFIALRKECANAWPGETLPTWNQAYLNLTK
jgi:hypothetical protein